MILKKKYIILFLLLLTMFSCKQQKLITNSKQNNISYNNLKSEIISKNQQWEQIVIKGIKITIDDNSTIINLKGNIILSKDSTILISLANFMGIEITRALLNNDSIKVIDRMNKKYSIGSYNDISNKYDIPLDFIQLQSVLIANFSGFFSNEVDTKYINDTLISNNNGYEITVFNNNKSNIKFNISSDNFTFKQVDFINIEETQKVLIDYIGAININSQQFPEIIEIEFEKGNKNLQIAIQYKNITLEKYSKLELSIPKNYQQNTIVGYVE